MGNPVRSEGVALWGDIAWLESRVGGMIPSGTAGFREPASGRKPGGKARV
ncbi:conserved protein of unknown function [Ectopseudomonas oleovorans]|uniref:Uncharacterized protein n=1 Tax=Ectopseudomonas oleovorans TaxID=301 RepID=A0A653B5E4_ECTOL|nr:conserved protein of unknown function [Pseudomonas oleovorans]